ncbi:MAG: hypothetical protein NXY57DRAFT_1058505 [Lentinula lateritia]|uniref:Uncharacterized protein n=1 Tax=Lentinula lateritia TaxID=40482 RepID=A0ABQ8UXL0_9AGAR|nr:MAG: hypothetical protein NXY57DRAFT_1058505 [Lentinula lateritia]KAJ4464958.1 hypothetical protein C8R41DRAFT_859005 [Lentinula lateritia]
MLSTLTIVSLLSAAVLAQDSLVPSGISSDCSTFLETVNNNSTIQSCLSPVIAASSSSSASASTLSTLCSTSICDDSLFRSTLSSFASACSSELTSNSDVVGLYDVLYIISPMKTALCSKSDSGSYCALSATSTSSSAAASASGASAATLASQAQQYISTSSGTVNGTTFSTTNLAFMFLQSTLTSAQCTTCTRNIMTSYINFESNAPYAPGIASSSLLSQQTSVYNAITSVCGSNFLSGVVQAAGGISTGSSDNGSLRSSALDIRTIAAVIVGITMAFML